MTAIHLIHENPAWLPPFAAAFEARGLPWRDWDLSAGTFDLSRPPPEGVFYSRMSASSHTRGHAAAPALTGAILAWLERHGRRVVNGGRALDLEVSKARQYAALEDAGITVPRTVAVTGDAAAVVAAADRHFGGGPVILKPNRGGKGLGVRLFADSAALAAFLAQLPADEAPVDGLWLLQAHIRAPRPVITRAEFVGGRFLYAVEVDTSGGFELCPADVCEIGDAACPAEAPAPKFRIIDPADPALIRRIEAFLAANAIEIAGVEFIRDASGSAYVYDVNTNTNYNPDAEAAVGIAGSDASGPGGVAAFLGRELAALRREAA